MSPFVLTIDVVTFRECFLLAFSFNSPYTEKELSISNFEISFTELEFLQIPSDAAVLFLVVAGTVV